MIDSPCTVCGQESHGSHFGVKSCRACAAFFRRYANSKLVSAQCKKRVENGEKCFCRPCRIRSCVRAGMDSRKFQYNRDSLAPYDQLSVSRTVAKFTGQPEFLMFRDPSLSPSSSKSFIDVHKLIFEATRLLNYGCGTPVMANSQLKKLALGSNFLRLDTLNIRKIEKFGKTEFVDIVEFYFTSVLKWIVQFDEFQKLDKNLQMTLLYSFWLVWMKYHKCSSTADFRRNNKNAKPTEMIMRNVCMDRSSGFDKLDTSWFSDYPHEYVAVYMNSQNIHEDEVIDALLKLNPTDMELTFMFAYACFEYTAKRYHGKIQGIMERFQQVISNDLHNYYVNERQNPRYIHRLTELTKVNNLVQKSIWESRPQRDLNKVFDVIKIGFSHPEMFQDSEFS